MIGYYDYTVVATYAATGLGLWGMFRALDGQPLTAVFCLLAAGLLDAFDGRIARSKKNRSPQEKSFGIQIDSLNDVLCFGALPAVTAYSLWGQWQQGQAPLWYGLCLVFFALAGLIRLAYFNVMEEERQKSSDQARKYYLGLPITAAALGFPLLYLLGLLLEGSCALLAGGMVLLGLLYILPLRIPKPGLAAILLGAVIGAAELAGLILAALGQLG